MIAPISLEEPNRIAIDNTRFGSNKVVRHDAA